MGTELIQLIDSALLIAVADLLWAETIPCGYARLQTLAKKFKIAEFTTSGRSRKPR